MSIDKKIVTIVCLGNTCRSQLVAIVASNLYGGVEFRSAGLMVEDPEINPLVRQYLEGRGMHVPDIKPRQLTPEIFTESDLVLMVNDLYCAMLQLPEHRARIYKGELTPESLGKTFPLSQYVLGSPQEYSDPAGLPEEAYFRCLDHLYMTAEGLARKVQEQIETGVFPQLEFEIEEGDVIYTPQNRKLILPGSTREKLEPVISQVSDKPFVIRALGTREVMFHRPNYEFMPNA